MHMERLACVQGQSIVFVISEVTADQCAAIQGTMTLTGCMKDWLWKVTRYLFICSLYIYISVWIRFAHLSDITASQQSCVLLIHPGNRWPRFMASRFIPLCLRNTSPAQPGGNWPLLNLPLERTVYLITCSPVFSERVMTWRVPWVMKPWL